MMRCLTSAPWLCAVTTAALTGVASLSLAGSVADFYRSRNLELIVGTGAGGGYDATARLVARHLGRLLPGNPKIVVTNVPGSSGIQSANRLYNISARDGTVIGTFSNAMITIPLFGNAQMLFDPPKFSWLGSVNHEDGVCIATKMSGISSWSDVTKREVQVGVTTAGSTTYMYAALLRNAFGAKFKFISGYPDSSQIALAIQRNEVDAICQTYSSVKNQHPDWLSKGLVKPILVMGFNRLADLPDVPTVFELTQDAELQNILKVILAPTVAGRPFLAPPGTPQDRLGALRDAFDAMTKDTLFLDDARKLRIDIQPETGRDVETLIKNIYSLPPALIAKTKLAVTIGGQGQ